MKRTLIGVLAGLVIGVLLTAGASSLSGATEGENPIISWVPDLREIMSGALNSVFDAAGEDIRDPEIREFYIRLTREIADSINSTSTPTYTGPDIPELQQP